MSRAAAGRGREAEGAKTGSALSRSIQGYYTRSNRPLTILLFLSPLIILYEVGTRYYASDWTNHTETRVLAFNLMRQFLAIFGATAQYLPCLAVVVILLAWHFAHRDPWEFNPGTATVMALEACLLAIPVLAIGKLLGYVLPLYSSSSVAWKSGIVLALGAGIYEELVFRLAAFTILDIVLVDLLKVSKRPAMLLIVFITSFVFAAYHYWSPQSGAFHYRDFIFRMLSGAYFGALLLARGFGITCGAHTAYDMVFFGLPGFAGA